MKKRMKAEEIRRKRENGGKNKNVEDREVYRIWTEDRRRKVCAKSKV